MSVKWPLCQSTWDEEEKNAIRSVLDSDRLTIGPEVAAFEEEFAAWHGAKYCVMVNSGSSANLLAVAAIHAIDASPGDWVVPALGWATTYSPLHQHGYRMRVVDVGEDYNIDTAAIPLDTEIKGVMAVNVLGVPADWARLQELKARHGLWLIEDNCESLGAELDGRKAGTFGDIGTFSFFFSHHISTMEGGACLTDSYELYRVMKSLRSHGWTRGIPDMQTGSGRYEAFNFVLPGYNLRPIEMAAAVGRVQLKKLPDFLAARRRNHSTIYNALQNTPTVQLQKWNPRHTLPSSFAFGMEYRGNRRVEDVLADLTAAGIENRPLIAGNILKHPVATDYYRLRPRELPVADRLHDRSFYVGNSHLDLSDRIPLLRGILRSDCMRHTKWLANTVDDPS
jgi:CDP-6-deoxy-D-xylo-4-hexulose-3-dehydrase